MGTLRPALVTACLFTLWFAAAPSHAAETCYQRSELVLFEEVVQVVSAVQDFGRGCWLLRLRLQDWNTPQGHAMFCGHTACDPRDLTPFEGIYWLERSRRTRNVGSVSLVEGRDCSDVTLCIVPRDPSETLWLEFVAIFEEGYHLRPPTFRPRWRQGLIGFSSFDGRSHCQDDDPRCERRGSICLTD